MALAMPAAMRRPHRRCIRAHLIHRYSFDGEGTQVVDSVGSADGSLQNGAVLDGAGHVTLDGKDDYVNLPNGLLSGLTDATLVAWLAWSGGPEWQRVFDFGSTDAGEDMVGNATSSLFLTPKANPGTGSLDFVPDHQPTDSAPSTARRRSPSSESP